LTQPLAHRLAYWIYRTLQWLAAPGLLAYLGLRILRDRRYLRSLAERFGFLPRHFARSSPGAVWLHAVSVGEVMSAIVLLRGLRESLPEAPLYVSVSTLAGRAMAEQKLAGLAEGVFFVPLDYCFAVRRVLRTLKPSVVAVMETEIWPNLWREASRSGARLVVVNGRISDKALPRYRRFAWFFRAPLALPHELLAQDAIAAERYRALGAGHARDAGNLKFDFDPSAAHIAPDLRAFLDAHAAWPVVLAASTMPPAFEGDVDEDELIVDVYRRLAQKHPGLLLILVPRRPERFGAAAARLAAAGIPHVRRSALAPLEKPGVLLLDTIGELSALFAIADAVFVGGSVAARGGHNVLEPAAFGRAIVTGPNNQNFQAIADDFIAHGAMRIATRETLAHVLDELLVDAPARHALGERARQCAQARRGATGRAVETLARQYDEALPQPRRAWPMRLLLTPLTWAWRAGMAADRAWKSFRLDFAPVPVISAGNLAMGGTGKTPVTLWLCREAARRGLFPAVLLRGYKRRDDRALGLLPGDNADVAATGEEAQLLLRAGAAAVGVAARRMDAFTLIAARRQPDVVLLDDGFQHWRMRREFDIVLIDALDPFRGGVFPLGRLREPFSALRRADLIVVTRARPGRRYPTLLAEIRRHNPHAPVAFARMRARVPELPSARIGAFCGLGQPEAFRVSLAEAGVNLAFFEAFPDHHQYTQAEIAALSARADFLLTTEKDLLNLP
jgi:3-deoxy-D-manno-octulosonic-acid transferase